MKDAFGVEYGEVSKAASIAGFSPVKAAAILKPRPLAESARYANASSKMSGVAQRARAKKVNASWFGPEKTASAPLSYKLT